MPISLGKFSRRVWMLALATTLLALSVGGTGLAWWLRDPWPVRLIIPIVKGQAIEGFTDDGRCVLVSQSGRQGGTFIVNGYDLTSGAIGPGVKSWSNSEPLFNSHDMASLIQEEPGTDPLTQERDQGIVWRDVRTPSVRKRLSITRFYVRRMAFADDDRSVHALLKSVPLLRPGGQTKPVEKLVTWNIDTDAVVEQPITIQPKSVIAYSNDSWLCADLDMFRGGLQIRDLAKGKPRGGLISVGPSLAFNSMGGLSGPLASSPDGRLLILIDRDGRAHIVDLAQARVIRTIPMHSPGLWATHIGFSPDGRLVVSSGQHNYFAPIGW